MTLHKRVTMIYGEEIRNLPIQTLAQTHTHTFSHTHSHTYTLAHDASALRLHFVWNSIGMEIIHTVPHSSPTEPYYYYIVP